LVLDVRHREIKGWNALKFFEFRNDQFMRLEFIFDEL